MRPLLILCFACLLLAACARTTRQPDSLRSPQESIASALGYKLEPTGKVQLLRLSALDPRPFFRVGFNIKDRKGEPLKLDLGNPSDMEQMIKRIEIIRSDHKPIKPFYVSFANSGTAAVPSSGRDVMMLIDTSCSMRAKDVGAGDSNRFQTAQDAAKQSLQDFRDGVDNISIVHFDSHQVVATIKRGRFVNSKAGAEEQINDIAFDGENCQGQNTALYTSVVTALDVLTKRRESDPSRSYHLIVLTDGKNDVQAGDDSDLTDSLETVLDKSGKADIPIYTVGFGSQGKDFDPNTLGKLAYPQGSRNYFPAGNATELQARLKVVQQLTLSSFNITFFDPVFPESSSLRSFAFKVALEPKSGPKIESSEITWACPDLSTVGCTPSLTLGEKEGEAWRRVLPTYKDGFKSTSPWASLLWSLAMLAMFSGGLAFMWFVPPIFLWPKPQIPRMPAPARSRPSREAPKANKVEPRDKLTPTADHRKRFDETRVMPRNHHDK